MSDILKSLGIDPDDLTWFHLAACSGLIQSISMNNTGNKKTYELDPFFDLYESDQVVARQTDQMCISCPVSKQCLSYGIEEKATGVWGGIYLSLGKPDKKYNGHKTPEVWRALKKIHGKLDTN